MDVEFGANGKQTKVIELSDVELDPQDINIFTIQHNGSHYHVRFYLEKVNHRKHSKKYYSQVLINNKAMKFTESGDWFKGDVSFGYQRVKSRVSCDVCTFFLMRNFGNFCTKQHI